MADGFILQASVLFKPQVQVFDQSMIQHRTLCEQNQNRQGSLRLSSGKAHEMMNSNILSVQREGLLPVQNEAIAVSTM